MMLSAFLTLSTMLGLVATMQTVTARNLLNHVDTRIGTGGKGWGIGQTPVGPQVPFGAMRLSPDTSSGFEPFRITFEAYGGYYYPADFIECFSHTHMVGSGINDYQNFGVTVVSSSRMPNSSSPLLTDALITNAGYRSLYSHADETALPGYYAVKLQTYNVDAEVTVSGTHSGIHRYTCDFSNSDRDQEQCVALFDLCHVAVRSATPFDMGAGCKEANVLSLEKVPSSQHGSNSSTGSYALSAHVFNYGDMSGLGPRGGIDIWFYVEIDAEVNDGGSRLPLKPTLWRNNSLLQNMDNHSSFPVTTKSGSLGVALAATTTSKEQRSVVFTLRTGISFVSAKLARENLYKQQRSSGKKWKSFDQCKNDTQTQWNDLLNQFHLSDDAFSSASDADLKVFYSSVYRAHLAPTTFSESNGQYLGEDQLVHTLMGNRRRHVSDLSLWDIYRDQATLLIFSRPDVNSDLVTSMVSMYNHSAYSPFNTTSGHIFPTWPLANVETHCMVGHHGVSIAAESIQKSVGGIDINRTYEAVMHAVNKQNMGEMAPFGFVPIEKSGRSVGKTLEFSVDAAAAQILATHLGRHDDADQMAPFAEAFTKVWNHTELLFCPTYSVNQSTECPIPWLPYPLDKSYIEGSGEQYRWYVPHNITQGLLTNLFRNDSATFVTKLSEFFHYSNLWMEYTHLNTTMTNPWFWAGNEPSLLTPALFNFAGNEYAHLTQRWWRELLDIYYFPYPAGVPGNDDYGAMSSWVIFAYLGFYPVTPTDLYTVTTPRFSNVTVYCSPEGVSFSPWRAGSSSSSSQMAILRITTEGSPSNQTQHHYIKKVFLNGNALATPFFTHKELIAVANGSSVSTLHFVLTSEPCVFGGSSSAVKYGIPLTSDPSPTPSSLIEQERAFFEHRWKTNVWSNEDFQSTVVRPMVEAAAAVESKRTREMIGTTDKFF